MITTLQKTISTIIGVLALLLLIPQSGTGQQFQEILDGINFREIGPTRQGGRYVDYAVVKQNTSIIYAATGSGGLWKSRDNGFTWNPIFDDQPVISIGDVTVAPTDPNTVWVGTGEANNSRSTYWGNGVYKSTDAGKTWTHMGLPESHHIGRIIIDPNDKDVVYVAALGHLYSENPERGLYKTTDGGESWEKVLEVVDHDKYIGIVDVAMHPSQPNVLYAAAYDKVRRPWTFNPGGPGSGIYKSTNAGASWTKLTEGLPGGMLGRIGLAIAPSNPEIVYANVENVNIPGVSDEERYQQLLDGRPPEEGDQIGDQIYRSDDAGQTWYLTHPDSINVGGGPAYYYQQVRVDPTDPDHVYVLGVRMWETEDGGKTWDRPFRFGGDNHAMWIDPANPNHMLLGYDHGMGITYDAGENWYHPDELPLAQFYAIGIDMEYPYNVYGGTQDNGSLKGPSQKRSGNPIRLEDWKRVGGGDGMYNEVDPTDSRWLYNESQFGPLVRRNQVTGEAKSIAYRNQDRSMRWNWNSPILISPHNPDVIYHAGNKVVKSPHRGEYWEVVSPDLTNADSAKIVGIGNIQYATITTIDESPINEGELWAGTDDGNVWVTRNGGEDWTKLNENIEGNPEYWVSRVIASHHDPGTAYVSYTGYRRDDFRAFIYKTTDWGETWTDISNNLPEESINVVREDHSNKNLLFAGTDLGLYTSIDGGQTWNDMGGDMPTQPVHDLKIHPRENDLVVGTHGRGMFITDISYLQEFSDDLLADDFHLFKIEPVYRWVDNGDNAGSYINFNGEVPSNNTVINYYLKEPVDGSVTIGIYKAGRLIYEFEGSNNAGLNRAEWNKEYWVRERTEEEKKEIEERIERLRNFGWSDQQIQDYRNRVDMEHITGQVDLGTFTVQVTAGTHRASREAEIREDHWYNK